jgi:hypothetical protein
MSQWQPHFNHPRSTNLPVATYLTTSVCEALIKVFTAVTAVVKKYLLWTHQGAPDDTSQQDTCCDGSQLNNLALAYQSASISS